MLHIVSILILTYEPKTLTTYLLGREYWFLYYSIFLALPERVSIQMIYEKIYWQTIILVLETNTDPIILNLKISSLVVINPEFVEL